MNKELERLIKQKKEIEQRIRELKNDDVVCGCVKLSKEHYPTPKPDEWFIAVKRRYAFEVGDRQVRYDSIIRTHEKQHLIPLMVEVINDLTELKERLRLEE